MSAENLEQLAAKLGRPPTSLSSFRGLTPDQLHLLSDAIDEAVARQRRILDSALAQALPTLPRQVVLRILRARAR